MTSDFFNWKLFWNNKKLLICYLCFLMFFVTETSFGGNPQAIRGASKIKSLDKLSNTETISFKSVYPKAKIMWQIGSLNRSKKEFSQIIKAHGRKKIWDFVVGKDNWSLTFPYSIGGTRPYSRPEAINISFKISKMDTYTLVMAFTDAKNLLNTFELYLDGKKIAEHTIVGNNPKGDDDTQVRFTQTMQLQPGEHKLMLAYKNPKSRYYWIMIDAIALLKGTQRSVYKAGEFDRKEKILQRKWCEPLIKRPDVKEAMGFGSLEGTDFDLVFNIPSGKYELELGFSESIDFGGASLVSKPGMRVFDVYINGKKVLSDYDILKKAPVKRMLVERFPVIVSKKQLVVRLVGKKGSARISRARIFKNGKCLKTYEFIRGQDGKTMKWNFADHCFESPTNLVPNPGFELVDTSGNLHSWVSMAEKGSVKHVTNQAHKGKASLRVSGENPGLVRADTMGVVCDDKPYTLSFWVKTNGKCRVRPKIFWYRCQVQYRKDQIKRYREAKKRKQTESAGVSSGRWISGSGWKKITLTATPPRGANGISYGLEWEGGNGYAYVDDFFLDGLGALPMELILSQGGYDTQGTKQAVLFTQKDNKCKSGIFILRKASNDIVTRKKLQFIGPYPWKYPDEKLLIADSRWNRNIWIADFSNVREPGRYSLEVLLDNGEVQRSQVFTIKQNMYGDLSRYVTTTYFPVIRCGTNVPGWHPPCHTDDADFMKKDGKRTGHKAVFGGWHDAGDMNIFENNISKCSLALAIYSNMAKNNSAILKEASWGLDHLVRVQLKNSGFPAVIISYPTADPMMRPDKATDGDPNTPDNRIFKGTLDRESVLSAILAFYKAANQLDKTDPAKAKRYRLAAGSARRFLRKRKYFEGYGVLPWKVLIGLASKNQKLANEAISPLIDTVKDRLCLDLWPISGRTDLMYLYALLEFAKLRPDHNLTPTIRKEVRSFIDEILVPASAGTPFRQAQELRTNRRRFAEQCKGYDIGYKYSVATVMAYAAEVLKHRPYLELAEAQIHWGLGLNPVNISAIAGIGWRQQASFNVGATEFVGHENGQYPGATHHGIISGSGHRSPAKRRLNASIPRYWGSPFDFPIGAIVVDYPSFPPGGEPWIAHAAPFILACAHLDSAMKSFKKK